MSHDIIRPLAGDIWALEWNVFPLYDCFFFDMKMIEHDSSEGIAIAVREENVSDVDWLDLSGRLNTMGEVYVNSEINIQGGQKSVSLFSSIFSKCKMTRRLNFHNLQKIVGQIRSYPIYGKFWYFMYFLCKKTSTFLHEKSAFPFWCLNMSLICDLGKRERHVCIIVNYTGP